MYIIEVQVSYDGNSDTLDRFYTLLGTWRSNGQVLGKEFPIAKTDDSYRTLLMIPRLDSLQAAHDSCYSERARRELAELATLETVMWGEDPEGAAPCECGRHTFFILFTTYISLESPLRCGSCFGPLPLYILPKHQMSNGELHDNLMTWQSDYRACDTLQMNCSTGEKFGLREMSNIDSSLTKRGREIGEAISLIMNVPTYYYLHRYRGRNAKREHCRKCPSCGGEWLLSENLHERFDFKCHQCRLLSNFALSIV